jgi:hypothetical protein
VPLALLQKPLLPTVEGAAGARAACCCCSAVAYGVKLCKTRSADILGVLHAQVRNTNSCKGSNCSSSSSTSSKPGHAAALQRHAFNPLLLHSHQPRPSIKKLLIFNAAFLKASSSSHLWSCEVHSCLHRSFNKDKRLLLLSSARSPGVGTDTT